MWHFNSIPHALYRQNGLVASRDAHVLEVRPGVELSDHLNLCHTFLDDLVALHPVAICAT
jgi:hypothetical protein